MSEANTPRYEGGLKPPARNKIDWRDPDYFSEDSLRAEMERVFEICHGCRRCFKLCEAFPILFNAIDASPSGEPDDMDKSVYWKVVDNCYLCDMCFLPMCPYIPPHEWNIDFPHVMLRAKAQKFRKNGPSIRDRMISDPDLLGKLHCNPVAAPMVNMANRVPLVRSVLESTIGIAKDATLPEFQPSTLRRRLKKKGFKMVIPSPAPSTTGRVTLFATCYGNFNHPSLGDDLVAVFEHNQIFVTFSNEERCCGMPKLEMGDLASVEASIEHNAPILMNAIDEGRDIVVPMPSCAFMIKRIWPLLKPDDKMVQKIAAKSFDPFEYLALRLREQRFSADFKNGLGKIAYHVPCHIRALNIGLKTKEILSLIPDTELILVQRCSGHDGTYAMKSEFHATARKICAPVAESIQQSGATRFASDCPMAASHIQSCAGAGYRMEHPLTLLRMAYGI